MRMRMRMRLCMSTAAAAAAAAAAPILHYLGHMMVEGGVCRVTIIQTLGLLPCAKRYARRIYELFVLGKAVGAPGQDHRWSESPGCDGVDLGCKWNGEEETGVVETWRCAFGVQVWGGIIQNDNHRMDGWMDGWMDCCCCCCCCCARRAEMEDAPARIGVSCRACGRA
ncbi:hypothetical protein LIA77_02439 [Sarocladium implicatum]|nr:hypothetical protein LIA77_02439 [Sarocladium implicatum]